MSADITASRLDVIVTGKKHRLRKPCGSAETWIQEAFIGRGAYGLVYRLKLEGGMRQMAVKKIPVDDFEEEILLPGNKVPGKPARETLIRRELANLLTIKDRQDLFAEIFGWYTNDDFFFLAMEYYELGDLGKYLGDFGPLKETEARAITRQLVEGLMVLHNRDICHRDLKPQNILIASLSPFQVRVADFGISKSTNDTTLLTKLGTEGYIAPEQSGVWSGSARSETYTNLVDMWALGCVIHEIMTNQIPFTVFDNFSRNQEPVFSRDLYVNFCRQEIGLPISSLQGVGATEICISFIAGLLQINTGQGRMGAAAAITHDWIHQSRKAPFITAAKLGDLESLGATLLVDTTVVKDFGHLALPLAAGRGHLKVVEVLLLAGAEVNAPPVLTGGRTALHAAAERGDLDIVHSLLRAGANVNAISPGSARQTALQMAAGKGHLGVVDLLLTVSANVNAPAAENFGRTALQAAAEEGHLEVAKLLLAFDADVNTEASRIDGRTALQAAAGEGYIEVVEALLAVGAHINAPPGDDCGRTALQAAAEYGDLELVVFLLANGAEVNTEAAESGGRTALQAAAGEGNLEVVEALLSVRAHVNAPAAPDYGRTALQAAAEGGHLDVVEVLLNAGAHPDGAAAVNGGRTALQAAAEEGHSDIARRLVAAGADLGAVVTDDPRAIELLEKLATITFSLISARDRTDTEHWVDVEDCSTPLYKTGLESID